jgi:hypothetical protein
MRQMWNIVKIIDKYGVEVRGIERVLPHERSPVTSRDWLDNLWMWLAANCTVRTVDSGICRDTLCDRKLQISTLALGTLGPSAFVLSGKISILTIIFFNLLSTVLSSSD